MGTGQATARKNLVGIRRLLLNIVHLEDDRLSIRRRLLRAAQMSEYRFELIGNGAKLAETL